MSECVNSTLRSAPVLSKRHEQKSSAIIPSIILSMIIVWPSADLASAQAQNQSQANLQQQLQSGSVQKSASKQQSLPVTVRQSLRNPAASQQSSKNQTGRTQVANQQKSPASQRGSQRTYATDHDSASNKEVRQFHEVLNDLLTEFSYDVKQGQINGLKNIAIRRVDVSETLPSTYEQYVELLVTERIRENSKVKLINCVACKTKSSTMIEGKLMITSPLSNVQKMDEAANQLGIENFMDIVLVYHTTHMVMAFNVFSTQTKELVWARTYNSETLRSRYQRLAVDYNQVEKSRTSDEYVPDYKILIGLGSSQLPNVAGTSRDKSFIGLHLRAVEKFDNRRLDFGLLSSIWTNTATFLKAYPSEGSSNSTETEQYSGESRPLPYKYVLGVHALVARNFVGDVEVYDRVRQGLHLGIGSIISNGYLAPSARAGWDIYFGRRFVATFQGHYIMQSTILVGSKYQKARGGGGGDLILSYNF
jgi:hypothetical protein